MDVLGNLDFKGIGKLKRAGLQATDFPVNPSEGELLFKDKVVYICVKILNGLPFWVPLTAEINTVRFDQNTPAMEWTINHNLGINMGMVQVYDADGKMILPDEIDCSEENTALIVFSTPMAGTAVIMYGNEFAGNAHSNIGYQNTYTNSTTWVVVHGLGYNPVITCVIDGYVVQPQSIVHDSLLQTTVTFSTAQSGSVRCV